MTPEPIDIKTLFLEAGKHLRSKFEEIARSNPHYGERGSESETILRDFLNAHIPQRFRADTGFILDFEGNISSQIDCVIFDALNTPIYRKGPNSCVFPIDNVAVAIEIKSNLNKRQLQDAANKISSVKRLRKSKLSEADEPVTFSELILTHTLGVVFAYDSDTTLDTLAGNLIEINKEYDSNEWIDLVIVLDKGIIEYFLQTPFDQTPIGWYGGTCSDDFMVFPYYVHLAKTEMGDLSLNKFFLSLISHLTFYRRRTTLPFESVLGKQSIKYITFHAYQYNLDKRLVDVEESHKIECFKPPRVRYNLYENGDKKFLGQVCCLPWQDGAVIMYSGKIPPELVFSPYFDEIGEQKRQYIPGHRGSNLLLSNVISISEEQFITVSEKFTGVFFADRDGDDDTPPWLKYKKK
jgi:hypothetical protein